MVSQFLHYLRKHHERTKLILIMSNDTTKINIPSDLEWEELSAAVGFVPDTLLFTEVEMWGITFYVEAFAVDESGEALAPAGARVLKSVR
jgi:hypothetical protein